MPPRNVWVACRGITSVSDIQLMCLFKDVVSDVLWCFDSLQSLKVASNSQRLKAVILSPSCRGSNYHVKILRKLLKFIKLSNSLDWTVHKCLFFFYFCENTHQNIFLTWQLTRDVGISRTLRKIKKLNTIRHDLENTEKWRLKNVRTGLWKSKISLQSRVSNKFEQ